MPESCLGSHHTGKPSASHGFLVVLKLVLGQEISTCKSPIPSCLRHRARLPEEARSVGFLQSQEMHGPREVHFRGKQPTSHGGPDLRPTYKGNRILHHHRGPPASSCADQIPGFFKSIILERLFGRGESLSSKPIQHVVSACLHARGCAGYSSLPTSLPSLPPKCDPGPACLLPPMPGPFTSSPWGHSCSSLQWILPQQSERTAKLNILQVMPLSFSELSSGPRHTKP